MSGIVFLNPPLLLELAVVGALAYSAYKYYDYMEPERANAAERAKRTDAHLPSRSRYDQLEKGSQSALRLATGEPIHPGTTMTGVTVDPVRSTKHESRDLMAATNDERYGVNRYAAERARNLAAHNPFGSQTWHGQMIQAQQSHARHRSHPRGNDSNKQTADGQLPYGARTEMFYGWQQ